MMQLLNNNNDEFTMKHDEVFQKVIEDLEQDPDWLEKLKEEFEPYLRRRAEEKERNNQFRNRRRVEINPRKVLILKHQRRRLKFNLYLKLLRLIRILCKRSKIQRRKEIA